MVFLSANLQIGDRPTTSPESISVAVLVFLLGKSGIVNILPDPYPPLLLAITRNIFSMMAG